MDEAFALSVDRLEKAAATIREAQGVTDKEVANLELRLQQERARQSQQVASLASIELAIAKLKS